MDAIQNVFGYMNYKSIAIIFAVFSIISLSNISIPAFAQQQQGINWLEICRNPLVDALITEPCETLTSPDGYTLTPEGVHVLGCIGGGTLALLTGQLELLALKDAVGCSGNSNTSPSSNTQSDQSDSSSSSSSTNTQQSDQSESPTSSYQKYDPNTNSLITINETAPTSVPDNQSTMTSSVNETAPSNQNMTAQSHAGASDQF